VRLANLNTGSCHLNSIASSNTNAIGYFGNLLSQGGDLSWSEMDELFLGRKDFRTGVEACRFGVIGLLQGGKQLFHGVIDLLQSGKQLFLGVIGLLQGGKQLFRGVIGLLQGGKQLFRGIIDLLRGGKQLLRGVIE
jgi:hypothetical protein